MTRLARAIGGHHVAPQERRGRPAVQQQHRRPGSQLAVGRASCPSDLHGVQRRGAAIALLLSRDKKPTDGLEVSDRRSVYHVGSMIDLPHRAGQGDARAADRRPGASSSASAATRRPRSTRSSAKPGVKRGALYHHFASKQALFDAVLDRVVSEVAEAVAEAARARRPAREPARRLRAPGCDMALDPAIQRIALLDPPVGRRLDALARARRAAHPRRRAAQPAADRRRRAAAGGGRRPARAHGPRRGQRGGAADRPRRGPARRRCAAGQAAVDTLLDAPRGGDELPVVPEVQ